MDPRRVLVAAAGASTMVVGPPHGPAGANPFGADTAHTGPFSDSAIHTFCMGASLSDTATYVFASEMNHLAAATVMDVDPGSCTSTTDVIASNADLEPGFFADYECFDYVDQDARICARSRIRLDESFIGAYLYFVAGLEQNSCHEIGHSVGLQHY